MVAMSLSVTASESKCSRVRNEGSMLVTTEASDASFKCTRRIICFVYTYR